MIYLALTLVRFQSIMAGREYREASSVSAWSLWQYQILVTQETVSGIRVWSSHLHFGV